MSNEIKKCDECGSDYLKITSAMDSLCPECSHIIYGYPNCDHIFENGRCIKCYWDKSTTPYIESLKAQK